MIKKIYILSMCILSLGLNQDKELVIREYMQNGRIDATIKDNNDQQLYLVQKNLGLRTLKHHFHQHRWQIM